MISDTILATVSMSRKGKGEPSFVSMLGPVDIWQSVIVNYIISYYTGFGTQKSASWLSVILP